MENMKHRIQLGNEACSTKNVTLNRTLTTTSKEDVCIRGKYHHYVTTLDQKLVCKNCGKPYNENDIKIMNELQHLLSEIASVFKGWHSDGTSWSEYDESVFKKLVEMQAQMEKDKTTFTKKRSILEIEEMKNFGNYCRIHDNKFPNEVWTIDQLFDKWISK